jgi:hypothetical protein
VWPDWLSRFLIDTPGPWVSDDGGGNRRSYTAPMFQREVNRVCGECNSGWMSDLETDAQPLLRWMILGRATVLEGESLQTIATWITKSAFMAAFLERDPAIPPDQYRSLYAQRTPPREVTVSISSHRGRRYPLYSGHGLVTDALQKLPGGEHVVSGYSSTFKVGALVGQVVGVHTTANFDLERPEWHMRMARQIWPLGVRVAWPLPPNEEIDDSGSLFRFARYPREM